MHFRCFWRCKYAFIIGIIVNTRAMDNPNVKFSSSQTGDQLRYLAYHHIA